MLTENNIPVLALIIEPLIALGMTILAIFTYQKYREREKDATLYLSIGIVFYSFSVWASSVGKWIQFYSSVTFEEESYSDLTISFAYCFAAVTSVFVFAFVNEIFLDGKKPLLLFYGILNGITIGMILTNTGLDPDTYDIIFPFVLYHAVLSLVPNGMLIYFGFKEASAQEEKIPKAGFTLIGFFGVFSIMVFILFAIDVQWMSYSPAYYAAWITAGFATLCGYIGYIMPNWFKRLIRA
ncbi:MAG: hypothetical protein KAR35_10110 [Candidatus Heimdallarchaeota archaeon]|nr:hypothetical protein [Candidatus Heimdallarchaeota archaeon]MCK5049710.1 hypothetical protein [Candidatus Heimdallarchaeota archaeon]